MEQRGKWTGSPWADLGCHPLEVWESPASPLVSPGGHFNRKSQWYAQVSFTHLTKEGSDLAGLVAVNFGTARI